MKKCFNFYKELWDELCNKYSVNDYNKFIEDILRLILDSNNNMLKLRERGVKEQRKDLIEIDIEKINGADFYELQ